MYKYIASACVGGGGGGGGGGGSCSRSTGRTHPGEETETVQVLGAATLG